MRDMIAVIDMVNRGISHEMFNAGMIYQIVLAYPNSKVVYFAESTQIDTVSRLVRRKCGELESIGYEKVLLSESGLLEKIADKYEDITAIVLTGMPPDAYEDVLIPFARCNKSIKIWVSQHGELEGWIKKERIDFPRLYTLYPRAVASAAKRFFKQAISLRRREDQRKSMIIGMSKAARLQNVGFLVFSDEYKKHSPELGTAVTEKMLRIYLPYIDYQTIRGREKGDSVIIGAMPSAVAAPDASIWRVIKYVNKNRKRVFKSFYFCLFRRRSQLVRGVITWESWDDRRENIEDFLHRCDLMLVPYGEEKYMLSSSGIAHDAIYAEVPLIMGGSHCFNQFDNMHIGIRGRTISEIGELLINEINNWDYDRLNQYTISIRVFKRRMESHNHKLIESLRLDNCVDEEM